MLANGWFWFHLGMATLGSVLLVHLLQNHRRLAKKDFAFRLTGCMVVVAGSALMAWGESHGWDTVEIDVWFWAFAFVAMHLVGRFTGHPDPLGLRDKFHWPWSRDPAERPDGIPR